MRLFLVVLALTGCGRRGFDVLDVDDATPGRAWLGSEWSYRKPITISAGAVTETLMDFPLSIVLDGDPEILGNSRPNGHDLRFTLDDGVTLVPFLMEQFRASGDRITAWVKPPVLSPATDTTLYVYYGNPAASSGEDGNAVYADDFRAVWYMSDVPTVATNLYDVAGGNHFGFFNGAIPASASVPGAIGNALDFDGVDDYVLVPDAPELRFVDEPFTIEAWAFMRDAHHFKIYAKGRSRPNIEYYFRTGQETDDQLIVRCYDAAGVPIGRLHSPGLTPYQNQWIHVAATYDGSMANSSFALYLNGERVDDTDAPLAGVYAGQIMGTMPVEIGHYMESVGVDHYANGMIDDLRLSGVVRSPGWIRATYRTVRDRSTLISVGPEQLR